MANANSSIKNSWSLIGFAREFGKRVATGTCTNHDTGETFKAVTFTNSDGTRTFVSFSRNLGELSGAEIVAQKDSLQVVLCETAQGRDMYALCKQGESSWQDVDLGL